MTCKTCEELKQSGNAQGLRFHCIDNHPELVIDEDLRAGVIRDLLNAGYDGIQAHQMTNTQEKIDDLIMNFLSPT